MESAPGTLSPDICLNNVLLLVTPSIHNTHSICLYLALLFTGCHIPPVHKLEHMAGRTVKLMAQELMGWKWFGCLCLLDLYLYRLEQLCTFFDCLKKTKGVLFCFQIKSGQKILNRFYFNEMQYFAQLCA